MLRTLIDDLGGIDAAARVCDVHAGTVRRWLRGATPLPGASYRALFAASSWARIERQTNARNERTTLLALVDALKRENAALRAEIGRLSRLDSTGSANAPTYGPARLAPLIAAAETRAPTIRAR